MSLKFKLVCSNCTYHETVSAGVIPEELYSCRTYQCLNCEILFDWYTMNVDRPEWLADILFCPMCMKGEIVEWDYETGVCPKCNQPMEITGMVEYRL